jgi:uroporphyrinogen-III synthase
MSKNGSKQAVNSKTARKILISQPKPESERSPYFDLERKHNVELVFHPFIVLEGIPARDFRKQKIDVQQYSGIIFTSRNAIDHFFRMSEELKLSIAQDTKYFCITEAVALYLQKFILYRKRKVFYGADGTNKSMLDVINKHKEAEKFLYVCSENQQDSEICSWLKNNKCDFQLAYMYRTISNDIKPVLQQNDYDMICFFTPSGVKSLLDNFPDFKQNGTVLTAFGSNTSKAVVDAGFNLEIQVPSPQRPSMVAALDQFLAKPIVNKAAAKVATKAAPKATSKVAAKAPSKAPKKAASKAPVKKAAKATK